MKAISNPWKNRYLKKVGFLLIAIALIAAILSCEGEVQYDLTMAVNPAGIGTAIDETGASPYASGTVVNIEAVAAAGYQFDSWTAPAGTFTDPNAATTTFTMPAQDVTVTANFIAVYDLTMAVNPAGAGTATDLTGASPYAATTVVDIQAAPATGYQFVEWTALAGTFGDPDAATTTFTMPAQNVTATANFVGPLDHFKGYWVDYDPSLDIDEVVSLEDQFLAVEEALVGTPWWFFNPAEKLHESLTPVSNPDHHIMVYRLDYEEEPQTLNVEVDNQFGTQQLVVNGPWGLAVPTQKVDPGAHKPPLALDHYMVYWVEEGQSIDVVVDLSDQFGDQEVLVYEPILFANPVKKTHGDEVTDILDPSTHLVVYAIDEGAFEMQVQVVNQFGEHTLGLLHSELLAVPSQKIVPPAPPLDHFKCYPASGLPLIEQYANLEDQFGYYTAGVLGPWLFCNPVEKNSEPIVNHDNHLTVYDIVAETWTWTVTVNNQFGNEQEMDVTGPIGLAVPTQKLEPGSHPRPKYLDHYLLYEVLGGTSVNVPVNLDDQFPGSAQVTATTPVYFANPVLYKYHDGAYTGVWDPETHLVFYAISPNDEFLPAVVVSNQFQEVFLELLNFDELLAVPSEKTEWIPWEPG